MKDYIIFSMNSKRPEG
jgi:hypothetical protein